MGYVFRDNSRIKDFRSCPTYHYYAYKIGLKPTHPRYPLIFGTAWHAAMDSVYFNFNPIRERLLADDKNTTREVVIEAVHKLAFEAFCTSWTDQGQEIGTVIGKNPRNTNVANDLIYNYIRNSYHFLEQHRTISIEKPFIIPLNGNNTNPSSTQRMYVGRTDKCVQNIYNNKYNYVEHKTSSQYSKDHGIQKDTVDEYLINTQVEGYYFNGKMKYKDEFDTVLVDFALVYNSNQDVFLRIPHKRGNAELERFLIETNYWWDRIDEAEANDFFPRNTNNCINKYSRCDYFNVCANYPDHRKVHDLVRSDMAQLSGFKIEFWEPFSFEQLEKALTETPELNKPTE